MAEETYRKAEDALWASYGLTVDERRISLARLGLGVRILEYGAGPTLLFVHGGPNAGSTWAPLVAGIRGFRCLILDRPGCGLSASPTRPPKAVRPFVTDMMRDVFDSLDEPLTGVVASSFGSYSALCHAAAESAEARPTVHFGCPALIPGGKPPLRFLLQALPGLRQLYALLNPPNVATARKALVGIGHGDSMRDGIIPDVLFEWYAALLAQTRTLENDMNLFLRTRPGRDALTPQDLSGVTARTSFFWGEDDVFGGADAARAVAAAMPGADLTLVPHVGHLPWLDRPDAAAEHVCSFFEAQT